MRQGPSPRLSGYFSPYMKSLHSRGTDPVVFQPPWPPLHYYRVGVQWRSCSIGRYCTVCMLSYSSFRCIAGSLIFPQPCFRFNPVFHVIRSKIQTVCQNPPPVPLFMLSEECKKKKKTSDGIGPGKEKKTCFGATEKGSGWYMVEKKGKFMAPNTKDPGCHPAQTKTQYIYTVQ